MVAGGPVSASLAHMVYKALKKQVYTHKGYSLAPIRMDDRFRIMKWRNEQIYHLRQAKSLTEADQDRYFNSVVAAQFEQEQPDQILFSYLEGNECIGYGGLVHINWTDRNAEISFIVNTELEEKYFDFHWNTYLFLIEQVAFSELNLHKLFVYAFDLRPRLYPALSECNYFNEARLKEHCYFEGRFIDVVIYSKFNQK